MENVKQTHEEKKTLTEDVFIPGHDPRETTPLFTRTRLEMLKREGNRCMVCGREPGECGPIESHHYLGERALANDIDWPVFEAWVRNLHRLLGYAVAWMDQHPGGPADIMDFIDDQMVNGMPLCKEHHTGSDSGIHMMDFPLFEGQAIAKAGIKYTPGETIIHEGTIWPLKAVPQTPTSDVNCSN